MRLFTITPKTATSMTPEESQAWADAVADARKDDWMQETMEQEAKRDACPRHGREPQYEWNRGSSCLYPCECDLGDNY